MAVRAKCPVCCRCICHDWPGHPAMHLPGVKGCPGKNGYVMNDDEQWTKEKL